MCDCPCVTNTSERTRYAGRNFLAHAVEGGIYMGGIAFVNASTLLPTAVKEMNGPNWLVALMPILMGIGFLLPPIFTAHLIERLDKFKPVCIITGIFQRLPFLFAGLLLIYMTDQSNTTLVLLAMALAPLFSGIFGGLSVTAWQQLLLRTIPPSRRSSIFAWRFIISCVIGIGAGWVVKFELERNPGPYGYGMLHLYTFAFLAISMIIFTTIREATDRIEPRKKRKGLIENLRLMPKFVTQDRNLRYFLIMKAFGNMCFIMVPFMAIYARAVLQKPESFLGDLQIAFMVGAFAGNFISGWVGDHYGCRPVIWFSSLSFIGIAIWSIFAHSDIEFLAIFTLFGVGSYAGQIGWSVLNLDICQGDNRASYLAIMSFINIPTLLLASALAAVLWNGVESYSTVTILSVLFLLPPLYYLAKLPDTREKA
ncbi:MAG: hypothetical protein JXR97_15565 [Planctomycetes bacterium]|nr:hypothetical protein [Planctomycetota bacterium]